MKNSKIKKIKASNTKIEKPQNKELDSQVQSGVLYMA